jgi:hypothetical protein
MKMSKVIQKKLMRMYELKCVIAQAPDGCNDEAVCDEYRSLLPSMGEQFLPLVDMLVKAGLISMVIDNRSGQNEQMSSECIFMGIEPKAVFENGNITISGADCNMSMPRHRSPARSSATHEADE